jgi:hypothetical protein
MDKQIDDVRQTEQRTYRAQPEKKKKHSFNAKVNFYIVLHLTPITIINRVDFFLVLLRILQALLNVKQPTNLKDGQLVRQMEE